MRCSVAKTGADGMKSERYVATAQYGIPLPLSRSGCGWIQSTYFLHLPKNTLTRLMSSYNSWLALQSLGIMSSGFSRMQSAKNLAPGMLFSWTNRLRASNSVLLSLKLRTTEVLEISNVHSERKIFAIFKLSRIWLLNYI